MLQFVLDPTELGPPDQGEVREWMARMDEIAEVLEKSAASCSSPQRVRHEVIAQWYEDDLDFGGLSGFELARFAEEVSARLTEDPRSKHGLPLLENVSLEPRFASPAVDHEGCNLFAEHLGVAGWVADRDGGHVGVLSPQASWGEPVEHVLVEAEVVAIDHPIDGLIETSVDQRQLREFLRISSDVKALVAACCAFPAELLKIPEFGVFAYWVGELDGDPGDLEFEVGEDFKASLAAMNYPNNPGLARRCLRIMALIAGGRDAEVEGHAARTGPGGNDPALTDSSGDTIMRSRLGNRTPDAHRLFWARGKRAKFLNVTGHDGAPLTGV